MDYEDIEQYLSLTSGPSPSDYFRGSYEGEILKMSVKQKKIDELTDGLSSDDDSVESFLKKFSIQKETQKVEEYEPEVEEVKPKLSEKKKKKKKKLEEIEPDFVGSYETIEPNFSEGGEEVRNFKHVSDLVKKFKERKKNK